ncbi:hypothetical protein JVU11DRAFT_9308 [Chiua virens]|nr:hypothetical protein JVU11DRAFT_9308 [Chiua virens]
MMTYPATCAPSIWGRSQSSTRHHQHFTLQVTYPDLEACVESTYAHVQIGETKDPVVIAFSLSQIQTYLGFEGWMWHEFFVFFFSFHVQGIHHRCAIIRWFDRVGDAPSDDTGMWVVKPGYTAARQPKIAVIHIDSIFCTAHLIPVYAESPRIPPEAF